MRRYVVVLLIVSLFFVFQHKFTIASNTNCDTSNRPLCNQSSTNHTTNENVVDNESSDIDARSDYSTNAASASARRSASVSTMNSD